MNTRLLLAWLGVLVLSTCRQAAPPLEAHWDALLDSLYAAHPAAVGIMVHVESPARGISWSAARGHAAKGATVPLTPDQPALVASNTKTFVSATILRLVEMGKLSLDQPIGPLLGDYTRYQFQQGGYDLEAIRVKHLLSHTSGIRDYADQAYVDRLSADKSHRWTRDEQLALSLENGPPLGGPGHTFSYADANYLLLSEIIEGQTGQPFYTAMRTLLGYEALGLRDTWMPTLEDKPAATPPLVHQYWTSHDWDSHDLDVSFDLYGGGGIACPPRDLAAFTYHLFTHAIVQDTAVLDLIFTEMPTEDPEPSRYFLGLSAYEYAGQVGYGHGGFWGTEAVYFPELRTAIATYILEKDARELRVAVAEGVVRSLK